MTRTDILNVINKILEEEHGETLTEEQLLIDSKIDSFGYAIFWCSLEAEYSVSLNKEVMVLDYSTFKVKDLIDLLESKINVSK